MAPDPVLLRQEAERKLFHFAWIVYPLIYYSGYPRAGMLLLTLAALLIWSGFEVARWRGYSVVSPGQIREHEKGRRVMGTFYQVLSLFLAVLLFDEPIAVLAMLCCCVGDAVTGFAGAILADRLGAGRTLIRDYAPASLMVRPAALVADVRHALRHRKSWLLVALMFVACLAPGMIAYPGASLAILAAGAAGAAIADAFAWRVLGLTLNDDLTITLASGAAMSVVAFL